MIFRSPFFVRPFGNWFFWSTVVSLHCHLSIFVIRSCWLILFFFICFWLFCVKGHCKSLDLWRVYSLTSEHDLLLIFVNEARAFIKDQVTFELELRILCFLEPKQLLIEGFEMNVMNSSSWCVCLGSQLIRCLNLFLLNCGIIWFVIVLKIWVFKCSVIYSLILHRVLRLFYLVLRRINLILNLKTLLNRLNFGLVGQ